MFPSSILEAIGLAPKIILGNTYELNSHSEYKICVYPSRSQLQAAQSLQAYAPGKSIIRASSRDRRRHAYEDFSQKKTNKQTQATQQF